MPIIMAWNIENFGARRARRGNYSGVVDFVGILLQTLNADVLVIQEFRRQGVQYLNQLQARMGVNWRFDYLPGAVNQDNRPNVVFGDLAYTSAANTEGYGVVYRQNQLEPIANGMSFQGSNAHPPQSLLNLVTLGRVPDITRMANVPIRPSNVGGNANDLGFPIPKCSDIAVSKKRTRSGETRPDRTIFSMRLSRCPCYCQVSTGGGNHMPFVVYHAPNGNRSSFYGTLITGLSGPLQGNGNAVVAGDFNITAQDQVQNGFDNFTNIPPNSMTAGTTPVGGNYPSSMVKYVDNVYRPQALIAADVKAQAQGSARDQLFYRLGAAPGNVGIVDLISSLHQNDPNYNANLTTAVLASNDIRTMVRNAIANNDLPEMVRTNNAAITDLQNTFTDPTTPPAAGFANYRTIAIFLNCFISDHLPVAIDV
jgi:hypothetical protein